MSTFTKEQAAIKINEIFASILSDHDSKYYLDCKYLRWGLIEKEIIDIINQIKVEAEMNKQKFTCQQCGLKIELETVFKFEVCPKCNGNLFPDDYVNPPDYKTIATDLELENKQLKAGIQLLLDNIDYTSGACSLTEMVGAVLPQSIISIVKGYLK